MGNSNDIVNKLINTFKQNIKFLETFDNELYSRVNSLSIALENGIYPERYALEYISENNNFDIYDKINNEFLYKKDIKNFEDESLNYCNFDLVNTIGLLPVNIYQKNNVDISPLNLNDTYKLSDIKVISSINQYKSINNIDIKNQNLSVKEIKKFVIIGTLLGTHIPLIMKKINPKHLFICEYNLEIFRLSLFLVNYGTIAKKTKLMFSIMDDDNIFLTKFKSFYQLDALLHSFYKYHSSNYNTHKYLNMIISVISSLDPLDFNYENEMNITLKNGVLNSLNHKILDFSLITNFFEKKVIFLGAGPSFYENITWIKENKDNFYIVCMGAVVKNLLEHDIIPNMIISLDSQYFIANLHFNLDIDRLKNTIKLFSNCSHPNLFEKFKNHSNVYLYETNFKLIKNNPYISGKSVGEVGFSILLKFKVKELFLLGIDLTLHESGNTHNDSYANNKSYDLKNKDKYNSLKKKNFSKRDDLVDVINNKGNISHTTRLFYGSIILYNEFNLKYNQGTKIYNLSENAAKLHNIEFIDKNNIKYNDNKNEELINIDSLSLNIISEPIIKDYISEYLKKVQGCIKRLEEFKKIKIRSYDQLLEYLYKLKIHITHNFLNDLFGEMYYNYSAIHERYLELVSLNTFENKDIQEFKVLWINQVLKLFKRYEYEIKKLCI